MNFNINHLTNAILDYMEKNELKNPSEFPTLAFYKFINESSVSDGISLKLTRDDDGSLKVMQMVNNSILNHLKFEIKDPTIPEPEIDPKTIPINSRYQKPAYEYIELDAHSDVDSLNKQFIIRVERGLNVEHNKILTDQMKKDQIKVYETLSKFDKFSDICDNITDFKTMIQFGDKKLYDLSQAIFSYKEYQSSLTDNKEPSDEIVIPSVLNRHVENALKSLIRLSEHRVQPIQKDNQVGQQIADISNGSVSMSVPSLLLNNDIFKVNGINTHVTLTNENTQNLSFSGSILQTIKDNVEQGTPENIVDDIYKNHISEDFKDEYALRLKMISRQKTLENMLEHEDLNNFIDHLKTKHPYIFKDNELFSYQSGVFENTNKFMNIAEVFNSFNLHDINKEEVVLAKYTDTTCRENFEPYFFITDDEPYTRLIGQTENSVKYLITGEHEIFGNKINQDMKVFKVKSFIMLNEEDNQFNKMACEELFAYCAKNKTALYISNEEPADNFDHAYKTLLEVAEEYKDKVYFIENGRRYDKVQNMCGCKTDMATFVKNMNDPNFKKQDYTITHGMKY